VLVILSLLAKATAMTLPAVLISLDVYLKRFSWRALMGKVPFVGVAISFAVLAWIARQDVASIVPIEKYSVEARILESA
jgi:hypothetical protein